MQLCLFPQTYVYGLRRVDWPFKGKYGRTVALPRNDHIVCVDATVGIGCAIYRQYYLAFRVCVCSAHFYLSRYVNNSQ